MRLNFDHWSELKRQLVSAISALGGMMVLGTVAYHLLEGWSWLNSFYFASCTLTTVGYGDLAPTTDLSRLFTAVYVLLGVSIAFASFTIVGTSYIRRGERVLSHPRGPQ